MQKYDWFSTIFQDKTTLFSKLFKVFYTCLHKQNTLTRSSADADNALDANEAVPNKWRADGTHNTYQSY